MRVNLIFTIHENLKSKISRIIYTQFVHKKILESSTICFTHLNQNLSHPNNITLDYVIMLLTVVIILIKDVTYVLLNDQLVAIRVKGTKIWVKQI